MKFDLQTYTIDGNNMLFYVVKYSLNTPYKIIEQVNFFGHI